MTEKIKMKTPLVEMDGDEMTRIIWEQIKETLLIPYIDLKTVPSRMALIVPLGLFHISLSLYSSTRWPFGVIVAHFTATPYFLVALAASTVIRSLVSSLFLSPRS